MVRQPLIAIVDDDQGVRGSLNSLLRSAGIDSVAFDSAEDLLSLDELALFDWVITDLNMPGLSGLELQVALQERHCNCAVIIMTAYPTALAKTQALQGGAVAFLTKPIDPDDLLDVIETGT